jgi:uncharacterized membrane protein YphA (DoxX/SURF4 family)
MSVVAVVLSVILALAFLGAGFAKVSGQQMMMEAADHFGFPRSQYKLIGVAEIAGAAGLLIGIAVTALGVAAAACLTVLMIGAVIVHIRAKDAFGMYVPALVLAILSGIATVAIASA